MTPQEKLSMILSSHDEQAITLVMADIDAILLRVQIATPNVEASDVPCDPRKNLYFA
jgi:hypothetical protein